MAFLSEAAVEQALLDQLRALDSNHRPPPCQDVSTGSLIQSKVSPSNVKSK